MNALARKCFAEAVGTYVMVFAGTGAMVVDDVTHGKISHTGVSLAWGLVIMVMIAALGETSGAHFNPAVSLGFFAARRFAGRSVLPYVVCQTGGAVLASLTLRLLFPGHPGLGATSPLESDLQAWVLEMILTAILMFVILCVSTGSKEMGFLACFAIGGTIGFESLFGGPMTGSSMNPARSLGPALVTGNLSSLWIYMTAPPLGALIGVAAWCVIRPPASRLPGRMDGPGE